MKKTMKRNMVTPLSFQRSVAFGFILASLSCLSANVAFAQSFEKVAPKAVLSTEPPAVTPLAPLDPEASPTAPDSDKVLVPSLRGLRLVDKAEKVVPNGVSRTGVMLNGLSVIDAPPMKSRLGKFLGKPFTRAKMHELTKIIVTWYRAHNRPVVDVALPEQDISTGVVQVVVTESVVGKVKVEGNKWFSESRIRESLRLNEGDIIDSRKLQQDMAWINTNPFRRVDAVFARGENVGTTDITLKTQDRFPLRPYVAYDNSGSSATGRNRWSLGANWGDAFGLDQQLAYQFTSSDDFWEANGTPFANAGSPSFMAHALNYSIPLPWRDRVDVFGAYERQKPDLGPYFGQIGEGGQAGFRYVHLLPSLSWLTSEVQGGFDYKTTNNNLGFGGTQIYASTTDVDQLDLTYKGTEADPYGQLAITNDAVYSPGNLTGDNTSTAFLHSGAAYAQDHYYYDRVELTRFTPLPWYDMSWVARVMGQISSGNLLPSERLSAGGMNSVRGYNENAAMGSEGFIISQELRSPVFSPSKLLSARDVGDKAQMVTFWDYAHVANNITQPNEASSTQLQGIGVGLRYAYDPYFTLRADYGYQLVRLPTSDENGQLVHLSVSLAY